MSPTWRHWFYTLTDEWMRRVPFFTQRVLDNSLREATVQDCTFIELYLLFPPQTIQKCCATITATKRFESEMTTCRGNVVNILVKSLKKIPACEDPHTGSVNEWITAERDALVISNVDVLVVPSMLQLSHYTGNVPSCIAIPATNTQHLVHVRLWDGRSSYKASPTRRQEASRQGEQLDVVAPVHLETRNSPRVSMQDYTHMYIY